MYSFTKLIKGDTIKINSSAYAYKTDPESEHYFNRMD